MFLLVFCFLTFVSLIFGSEVENQVLEFDLDTGVEALASDADELLSIVDWCSWFDDADFRIQSLEVAIHGDEARLQSYTFALQVGEALGSETAAASSTAAQTLSERDQQFVNRILGITRQWTQFQHGTREDYENFFRAVIAKLRAVADTDTITAILRQYTAWLIRDRERIANRIVEDKAEQHNLIAKARANTDRIRESFETRITDYEGSLKKAKSTLERIDSLVERGLLLRRPIEEKLDSDKGAEWSRELQSELQKDCLESVKRILFSGTERFIREMNLDLSSIMKKHSVRHPRLVFPIYLKTIDSVHRYLNTKRGHLERGIADIRRFISDSRGAINRLTIYHQ